jgi:hypothetical protein
MKYIYLKAHFYFILAAGVMLFFLVVYGFYYDHKEIAATSESTGDLWRASFKQAGLSDQIVEDLSHDNDTWYYQGKSVCVGYGDWRDSCKRFENVCSGGERKNVNGSADDQAREIKKALDAGGVHPDCPLIYAGTS